MRMPKRQSVSTLCGRHCCADALTRPQTLLRNIMSVSEPCITTCTSSCFRTPIESVRGRYGGGYQVAEWYFPHQHTLCAEQIHVLEKVMSLLSAEDQRIIRTILEQFSP